MLKVIQVGLNTMDLAGSLRLYSEAFGFRNAGASGAWGGTLRVQGLGPECRTVVWWLIGADELFQLELFSYSVPVSRPLPIDWKPSDHGWVRFGLKVADFDACMSALGRHGVAMIAPVETIDGTRRVAIRDPYIGNIIEIIEGGGQPGEAPEMAYMTSSVADIVKARRFYTDLLGFSTRPLESLHTPEHEALWGLAGARPGGFVVDTGGIPLEILHYPDGRARSADHRISDQGIMNIALGARERAPVADALARLNDAGLVPPFTFEDGPVLCGYIVDPGHEVELTWIPEEMEPMLGFAESVPFFG